MGLKLKKPPQVRTSPVGSVNYTVASVATVRHIDYPERCFDVVCYGLSHSELCSVDAGPAPGPVPEDYVDMGGGARLRRALERRGIDTEVWRGNLFETSKLQRVRT